MSAQQIPFRAARAEAAAAGALPFPPFSPLLAAGRPAAPASLLVESLGAARAPLESLIRSRFADAYEARIARFMPRLFSLEQASGGPLGAFGLREAKSAPLFLEHYLDEPIEAAIAAALGHPVARGDIVEVGQFAGSGAGAFRTLILRLTERLHREGHRWVVFTGTTALRNAFARLGLVPRELGLAEPERLPAAEQGDWGSYYQHAPRVMFGDIREGFKAISARLAEERA